MGNFFNQYIETILQIIEDKPNFVLRPFFFCLLIIILFLQIAGYIFSTFEIKTMEEPQIAYVAHLNEVSPGTFLLYMKGNDTLTLVFFFIMQTIMYFYYIYVGLLTYLKNHQKIIYNNNIKILSLINQFLNIFFTFFWWIFFTPFIEINSGVLVCGGNSFLTFFRDKDYVDKPLYQIILSSLGLFFTLLTCFIILFFFRNYEFNETNLLKRRFNIILVIQMLLRFLMTFFYYLNISIIVVFKHFVSQVLGISLVYDVIQNYPFHNQVVAKFYVAAVCFFEWSVCLCHLWIFTEKFPDYILYYPFLIIGSILSGFCVFLLQCKQEQFMKLKFNNDKQISGKVSQHLDFYLEELVFLAQDSQRMENSKFRLIEVLKYHTINCLNVECLCHKQPVLDPESNEINQEFIYKLVNYIFSMAIDSPDVQNSQTNYEHLSLKYISYLAEYRNNPTAAYKQLKTLIQRNKNLSYYFKQISIILSQEIEKMMEQLYLGMDSGQEKQNTRDKLNTDVLQQLENLKQQFILEISHYQEKKKAFWEKLNQGFSSIDDMADTAVQLARQGQTIRTQFQKFQRKFYYQDNLVFKKILSIFYATITNSLLLSWKCEQQCHELKKNDQFKSFYELNNITISKGLLLTIIISFSQVPGKIISKPTKKMADFFKYDIKEFSAINNINNLMPMFMSQYHVSFMENVIHRGYSIIFKRQHQSFAQDKNKFIFPVNLSVDHNFDFRDDFCLSGTIQKIDNGLDYIIFDQFGRILGISEQAYEKLFIRNINGHDLKILTLEDLYCKCLLFFLIPQILEIFKKNIYQIEQFKKMIDTIVCTEQRAKFKISKNLPLIQQQYYDHNQYYSSSLSHYKNTFQENQKLLFSDITKPQNCLEILEFVQDNKKEWKSIECLKDCELVMNIKFDNIIFGESQKNNILFFILEINEIIDNSNSNQQQTQIYEQLSYVTLQKIFNLSSKFLIASNNSLAMAQLNQLKIMKQKTKKIQRRMTKKIADKKLKDQKAQEVMQNKASQNISDSFGKQNQTQLISNQLTKQAPSDQTQSKIASHYNDNNQLQDRGVPDIFIKEVTMSSKNVNRQDSFSQAKQPPQQIVIEEDSFFIQAKKQKEIDNCNDGDQIDIYKIMQENSADFLGNKEIMQEQDCPNFGYKQPDNNIYINQIEIKNPQQLCKSGVLEDVICTPTQKSLRSESLAHQNNNDQNINECQSPLDNNNNKDSLIISCQVINQLEQAADVDLDDNQTKYDYEFQQALVKSRSRYDDHNLTDQEDQNNGTPASFQSSLSFDNEEIMDFDLNMSEARQKSQIRIAESQGSVNSVKQGLQSDLFQQIIKSEQVPKPIQSFKKVIFVNLSTFLSFIIIFATLVINKFNDIEIQLSDIGYMLNLNTFYSQALNVRLTQEEFIKGILNPQLLKVDQSVLLQALYNQSKTEYYNYMNQYQMSINEISQQMDQIEKIKIFQGSYQEEVRLYSAEMIKLNYDKIQKLQIRDILQNNNSETLEQIDSFKYLAYNNVPNNKLVLDVIDRLQKSIDDQLDVSIKFYLTFIFLALGLYIIIFFFTIPLSIRLNRYKEKILLLISRIHISELQLEINRIKQTIEVLNSSQESWLSQNFIEILTSKAFSQSTRNQPSSQKNLLQNKLLSQKLNSKGLLIALIFQVLCAILFFLIIIAIIIMSNNIFQPSFDLNMDCLKVNQAFNQLLSSSEIFINKRIEAAQSNSGLNLNGSQYFQSIDEEQQIQNINSALTFIKYFVNTFFQNLDKMSSVLDETSFRELEELFKGNVCSRIQCSATEGGGDYNEKQFTEGIAGILTHYVQMFIQHQELFIKQEEANYLASVRDLQEYINSKEHQIYFQMAFDVPSKALISANFIILKGNVNLLQKMSLVQVLYYMFGGFLFLAIFSLFFKFVYYKNSKLIASYNFLLTLIPYEKIADDTTNYLLKSIHEI